MSIEGNPRKTFEKRPSCVAAGECRPAHRSHKNTRDWCKGRVGVPHAWEWRRSQHSLDMEARFGYVLNRLTETRVCFGCEKREPSWRHRRSYCRQCGEPWETGAIYLNENDPPCVRCGAPLRVPNK